MSAPSFVEGSLQPRNLKEKSGFWEADFSSPVVFSIGAASSGDDDYSLFLFIDWGDNDGVGLVEPINVGQRRQFDHVYTAAGDYIVSAYLENSSGEKSPLSACPIRIASQRPESISISRYRGLALPVRSISEGVSLVEDTSAPEETALAVDASEGDMSIVVRGDGIGDVGAASVIIIEQPGRFVSSAQVVSSNVNVLELDRPLKDNYDRGLATVSFSKRTFTRGKGPTPVLQPDWFFPSEADRALLRASVSMLLSTAPYERPMRNSLGSRLYEIPFEQQDVFTQERIRTEVNRVIRTFEPRLSVVDVKIDAIQNSSEIKLFLTLNESDAFEGVPFLLDFTLVSPAN